MTKSSLTFKVIYNSVRSKINLLLYALSNFKYLGTYVLFFFYHETWFISYNIATLENILFCTMFWMRTHRAVDENR